MTQETFIIFVSITAVFLAGAAVGQLWLRLQLARLRHINLKRAQKRTANTPAFREPRKLVLEYHSNRFDRQESDIRDEIDEILDEIERS